MSIDYFVKPGRYMGKAKDSFSYYTSPVSSPKNIWGLIFFFLQELAYMSIYISIHHLIFFLYTRDIIL